MCHHQIYHQNFCKLNQFFLTVCIATVQVSNSVHSPAVSEVGGARATFSCCVPSADLCKKSADRDGPGGRGLGLKISCSARRREKSKPVGGQQEQLGGNLQQEGGGGEGGGAGVAVSLVLHPFLHCI